MEVSIMLKKLFCPVVFLVCAGTLLAQSAPSTTTPPAQNGPGRHENCFQQAGLERSVMEQIRSIVHDAHTQIDGVCSNSSLTPQQKNQQVREIREKAMQEREGLMTADQQKTVAACQQARHANHPAGNGAHEGLLGGCGEMPRGGSRPGGALNGAGNGTSNAPSPNQPLPQN
jgi:hypothetical protein